MVNFEKANKERINIMIEPGINKQVTKLAEEKKLSKSKVICLILANYFEEEQSKTK